MEPIFEDVTLQSLLTELLGELGASSSTLLKFERSFRLAYNTIRLMIGGLGILNVVFAFTDVDPILKKVWLVINMVFVSGLAGNFGARAEMTKAKKNNLLLIQKRFLMLQSHLGPRPIPRPAIIDVASGMPFPAAPLMVPSIPASVLVNSMAPLVKDPGLHSRILRVEAGLNQAAYHGP